MSSNDEYAPRSRRDRPRHDRDGALRSLDDDDYTADSRRPAGPPLRHSRYEDSPAPPYGSDGARRKKDFDPRDVEPKAAYRDLKDGSSRHRDHASDTKPRKSNTGAARRPTFDEYEDDVNATTQSHRRAEGGGGGVAFGRSKGYRAPLPEAEATMSDRDDARKARPSRYRPAKDDYADFEPETPRRAKSYREPDHHNRGTDDVYGDEPPRSSRRYRSPEDKYADRDRGYRSDGRDALRRSSRRDDDRSDDRRYRGDGGDGYASDKGHRRSDRDRDRVRHSDRDYRDHDRDKRDRDRDRDRDRRYYDSRDRDRDRDRYGDHDQDRRKKKGFSIDDLGKVYEQGQKHYKTVAPLVSSLAKMYLDNKK
ncbi:hypothetical protein A1O1_00935 [Capronia coronata CBS 617.96]|uniref:Uncharacterized protein n=1 Tax=Capronia coronata CBS 617.96 TaxID=1182541 RepID=W9Z2K8_9EURO|nr:uncharacterized protein A1O1_00935 [Capronia coronata CBS 617.96]EXJ95811.1 hypothetical protein A1O1_00935 [Capronia coronata CBS 617.96]